MRRSGLIVFVLFICIAVVQAQFDDCPPFIQEALESVDDMCAAMGRNTACYGTNRVDSVTVIQPRPEDFFLNPGERESLVLFEEIQSRAYDEELNTFGIAVLNAQANLPETLPGQSVIFLLMGDARLTNEFGKDERAESPFQAFYFLPGIGNAPCYEAEPMLTIQTPGGITTTIMLNGVETEMAPSTLLTITPSVCTIHRGYITQRVGDETATLLANQTVDIFIDEDGKVNVTNARGISEREYIRGEIVQNALNTFATANSWSEQFVSEPLQFDLEPEQSSQTVEATETVTTEETITEETSSSCETQHTIRWGETLHSIAERYESSVLSIVEANNLSNPRLIYVGQVLCIPHIGDGFEPLPAGY